jgi:hypothetical protein
MTSEGLGEMVEGDFANIYIKTGADPGERTTISVSGIF